MTILLPNLQFSIVFQPFYDIALVIALVSVEHNGPAVQGPFYVQLVPGLITGIIA